MTRRRGQTTLLLCMIAAVTAGVAAQPPEWVPSSAPASAAGGGLVEIERQVRAATAPLPDGARFEGDVVYRRVDGQPLRLDVYRPPAGASLLPAVVYVHGGGWKLGDKRQHRALFLDLVEHGYAVFSINYRLSTQARFPACIEDCKAAMRWVRAHADEYEVDRDCIAAVGASAGAHLVALLAVSDDRSFATRDDPQESSRPCAVVAEYGVYELASGPAGIGSSLVIDLMGGSQREMPEAYRRASPLAYVAAAAEQGRRPDFPPFLVIHGDEDRLVPIRQSRRMHAALRRAGAESELIEVRGGAHGLLIGTMDPPPREIRRRMFEFLDRHCLPTAARRDHAATQPHGPRAAATAQTPATTTGEL